MERTTKHAVLPGRWSEYSCRLSFIGGDADNNTIQNWQVLLNMGTRTFTFNSNSQSQSGFVGFVKNNGGIMSCDIGDNTSLCLSRPNSGNMFVEIRGIDGDLVTNKSGSDMNPWMAILTFEPITSSLVANQKYQDI